MKKILSIILGAVALVITASCAEEINGPGSSDNGKERIITVIATDKPAVDEEDSKTFIDGTSVKWSETGEYLKVFEVATPSVGEVTTTQRDSFEGASIEEGAKMSFAVSMPDKSGEDYVSFDYYAVYPNSAVNGGSSVTGIALNTSASQTPSATNFDAKQDLLIAKKINNGASQASSPLNMQFARVVAIGKMTIKNLESEDPITKITFSAKVGDDPVALAGRTNFNLETAKPVSSYASNIQNYSIILNYEGQDITANTSGGMVAYFTCYPFEINSSTPGSFKVVVETGTQIFTKEVNVSSAKGLAFNIGKASVFSVDMDNIEGEYKAVDLCYAYLEYSDVSSQLSNAYGNAVVAKAHGDRWSMNASNANSSVIGLKKDDVSSYIKLPDFEDEISSVTITLAEVNASNSLTLDSAQGSKTGDVATVSFEADQLEYTVDLSEAHVNTAYIHAIGGQAKITKVEVVAGTDTREAIDAPASVTAALNGEDANAIDVTWSTVEGASGYVITLVPDSGDDVVVVKANASPCKVSDLQYEMDYLVSVQAEPADYYLNKISAQTSAAEVVATGEDNSGAIVLTASDFTMGANAADITVNSKLGYRLGTSSNAGVLTIEAKNYATISFKAVAWKNSSDSFTITNGKVSGSATVSPTANAAATGTINSGASVTIEESWSEVTIDVTNPESDVVITSDKRVILWGFTATEYVPDTREEAGMSWSAASATATYNTGNELSFTPLTLTQGNATGITYQSTDETIASINSSTGVISITALSDNNVKEGSTTIKAVFAGDEDYKPQTASYTLTVEDSRSAATTPGFSPAAGTVAENTVVSFTPTDQGLTFHYTVDGTDPTVSSPTAASVTIDATKTVKVLTTKTGYKPSSIATAKFTLPSNLSKGEAWSYTFTERVWSARGAQTINTKSWTMDGTNTGSGSEYFGFDAAKGQQFGSNNNPFNPLTLTADFGNAYGVEEIRVATSGAGTASLSVSVGDLIYECGAAESASITSTNTLYTFISPDGELHAGEIRIAYTQTTAKGLYIKKIRVNPGAPTQLTMSAITCTAHTSSSLTFGWDEVVGATGYQISTDGGSSYGATQAATSFTWSGREPETNYTIYVKAIGDGDEYSDSAPCDATGTTDADSGSGGGGTTEYTSTLSFTAQCGGSGTADDGVEWTVSSDGTESTFDNTKGIHYGTSSGTVQYITLTTSDIPGTISKVVVNASTATSVTATVSVTVGGSAFGGAAQSLTSSAADYTFNGSASGEIVVTVTKPSQEKKAIYVKSIVVTYTN